MPHPNIFLLDVFCLPVSLFVWTNHIHGQDLPSSTDIPIPQFCLSIVCLFVCLYACLLLWDNCYSDNSDNNDNQVLPLSTDILDRPGGESLNPLTCRLLDTLSLQLITIIGIVIVIVQLVNVIYDNEKKPQHQQGHNSSQGGHNNNSGHHTHGQRINNGTSLSRR